MLKTLPPFLLVALLTLLSACDSASVPIASIASPIDAGAQDSETDTQDANDVDIESEEDDSEDMGQGEDTPDVMLPACQDDDLGPSSPQRPHALPSADRLEGLAACGAETDWFQADLQAGDTLSLALEVLSEPGLALRIFEGDQEVQRLNLGPGLQATRRRIEATGPVLVSVAAADGESRVAYGLGASVERGSPDDCLETPEEPNDAPTAAFEARAPLSIDAAICDADVDWYAFEVPAGGTLTISIDFAHALGDLDMRLFTSGDLESPLARSESTSDAEKIAAGPFDTDTRILLEVFGFRGATNAYRLSALPFGPPDFTARVEGAVEFEDRLQDASGFTGATQGAPGRSLRVEVVRVSDGNPVASGITDQRGVYGVDFGAHAGERYRVRALARAEVGALSGRVRDRSPARAIYALIGEDFEPVGEDVIEQPPLRAGSGQAIGGAMNIADTLGQGLGFVAGFTDRGMPALSVDWSPGEAFACGSCYGESRLSLGGALEDPDEYDDDIILHEFAHYFVDHLSRDSSPGGPHRDMRVSPRLAYGEGVAYFFASMVQGDPWVVDTFLEDARAIDLEAVTQQMEARDDFFGTSTGDAQGLLREEIVAAVLWDALDPFDEAEPFDRVELGEAGHMHLLLDVFGGEIAPEDRGAPGLDLMDWLNAASCAFPQAIASLAEITEDRRWPWDPEQDIGCPRQKGSLPSPVSLERRGDSIWAVARGALPGLTLRVMEDEGRARWSWVRCGEWPCVVSKGAKRDLAVAVGGRAGGRFVGASWLGDEARRRLLDGEVSASPAGPIRQYYSRK